MQRLVHPYIMAYCDHYTMVLVHSTPTAFARAILILQRPCTANLSESFLVRSADFETFAAVAGEVNLALGQCLVEHLRTGIGYLGITQV